MTDVGEWDSTLAMWYLFWFSIPLVALTIKIAINALPEKTTVLYQDVEVPVYKTNTVYKTKTKEKIVYRDKPKTVYKDRIVYRDRPQPKSTPKKEEIVDPAIKSDVVGGLKGLGVKKKDAVKIILNLCSKKKYTDSETLLRDCLSSL